jgi:hypothetical protein
LPLSIISKLRLLYLLYFSTPSVDRPVYLAIHRYKVRKIVELGIGDGRRALRMIEIARQTSKQAEVHYIGLDLFEGRPECRQAGISLKTAHRLLCNTGARVQLAPGDPADSLMRLANSLGKVDLLIVPAEIDSPAFARVWSFVPRMLHERTVVFIEQIRQDAEPAITIKPRHEIDRLAAAGVSRRAA